MTWPLDQGVKRTPVIVLPEVGSTNAEALSRAVSGEQRDFWIVAERQTAGRGRSGRAWQSPPGNLYATRLLWTACPARVLPQLSLVAGVAVIDAIRQCMGPVAGLRLKWPNDILVGGAKVGGILIESTTVGSRIAAAIGIGLNLARVPDGVDQAITSLADHGAAPVSTRMQEALDACLAASLAQWQDGQGWPYIRSAWLARAGQVGEPIRVHSSDVVRDGYFAGIDDDGALLMTDSTGEYSRYTFGDVSLTGAGGHRD